MIIHPDSLTSIREQHADETIVYGSGCFDLVHEGHIRLFSAIRAAGDIAIIGVTPDSRIRARKGPNRPIRSQDSRLAVVDAMRDVDYAFVTPEEAPGYKIVGHYVLQALRPDIYVTTDPEWEQDRDWLEERGTELRTVGRLASTISTSGIIERIRSQ